MKERTSIKSTVMTKSQRLNQMKSAAKKVSTRARVNTVTTARRRLPLLGIEDIIETRGVIVKETPRMLTIKLSRDIIKKLKTVYLRSQRDQSEYVGVIKMTRMDNKVKFNSPTRHTNWHPTRVFPPVGTNENFFVYHSHPVPVDVNLSVSNVTLPSAEDFIYYVGGYPKMQVNIILERNGYYIIDLLETRLSSMPDPTAAHAFFLYLLDNLKLGRFQVSHRPLPMWLFTVSIGSWQKTINTYIDKVMRRKFGLSIKYYRYSELPEITVKNPDTMTPS
jgi:hypothetical protein